MMKHKIIHWNTIPGRAQICQLFLLIELGSALVKSIGAPPTPLTSKLPETPKSYIYRLVLALEYCNFHKGDWARSTEGPKAPTAVYTYMEFQAILKRGGGLEPKILR